MRGVSAAEPFSATEPIFLRVDVCKRKIEIEELRKIGWSHWDPIGLKNPAGAHDEYDNYLLHVAGLLENGHSESEAVEYLVEIATNYMGLGAANRVAATKTVDEILVYVVSLGYRQH